MIDVIEYNPEFEHVEIKEDIDYVEDNNGRLIYSENVDRVVIIREEK